MFRKAITAAAALAMTAAPIAAQAAPQVSRTDASIGESEQLRGTTMWVVALIVVALLIWGGTKILDDDPDSP